PSCVSGGHPLITFHRAENTFPVAREGGRQHGGGAVPEVRGRDLPETFFLPVHKIMPATAVYMNVNKSGRYVMSLRIKDRGGIHLNVPFLYRQYPRTFYQYRSSGNDPEGCNNIRVNYLYHCTATFPSDDLTDQ